MCESAYMDYLAGIFVPTGNRRLNELIGFLMCVFALLLFLALVSYSPLDPSWNSASVLTGSHAARNWIGVVGAFGADMLLQFFGVGAFLLVIFPTMLGVRWFRSMKVQSPLAKSLGGIWLAMFVPALLALLPGHFRWMHVIPIEGLLGRVVGDFMIHYLNLVGAYIVCGTVLAVALVSLDGVLVLGDSPLGANALRLRQRSMEPLSGLEAGARQEAPAERTRAAPHLEAHRKDAVDPVASHVARRAR